MSQLEIIKGLVGNPTDEDEILLFCLGVASDIICDIRNSDKVEKKYLNAQVSMAVEIYNKRGAEGQTSHTENDIRRVYERGDISQTVIRRITPIMKTPFSEVRVVEWEL